MKRKTRMFSIYSFTQVLFALAVSTAFLPISNIQAQEPISSKAVQAYSISDLEVLQQANAYKEFFIHAHDILPTKRSKYWLDMVSNMAQGFIDLSLKQDDLDNPTFALIEKLSSWPELRGDEFYQIKRSRFALSYFKSCLSTGETGMCKKRMISFWKSARKDAETGYRILEYFAGFFPRHDTWFLLKSIVNNKEGLFYCDKPLVVSLTLNHLEKQHLYTDSKNKQKIVISQLASRPCWQKMANRAASYLDEMPTQQTRSIFVAFESTGLLPQDRINSWLTRYYLSNPKPGVLLNRAWSQLEKLSHNYAQRSRVLKSLMNQDPLPGQIFEDLGSKRNRTLYDHFVVNFPEYVQSYSKTCMEYREGKRVFPRGNPTLECKNLMAFDRKQRRRKVSQELHMRYSGTLKSRQP